MKTTFLALTMMLGLCGPAFSQLPAQTRFLVAGAGNPKVEIIDKSGSVLWSHDLNPGDECNGVAMNGEGNIVYSYKKGAKLVTRDHETVWDLPGGEGTETQYANVLPDGGYIVATCGFPSRITELDAKGNVRRVVEFSLGTPPAMNVHGQFRQVAKSRNGNYLVPVMRSRKLIEIDTCGTVVWEADLRGGRPFSVVELANGNPLVSCGDDKYFLEIDRQSGDVVRRIDEVDGIRLLYGAQAVPLDSGNLLICNWGGHSKEYKEPKLLELDTTGKVVWSMDKDSYQGYISAIWVIKQ